jgi:hypothetical protein
LLFFISCALPLSLSLSLCNCPCGCRASTLTIIINNWTELSFAVSLVKKKLSGLILFLRYFKSHCDGNFPSFSRNISLQPLILTQSLQLNCSNFVPPSSKDRKHSLRIAFCAKVDKTVCKFYELFKLSCEKRLCFVRALLPP